MRALTIRLVLLAALTASASLMAQGTPAITPQDIAEGLKDPGRWLTYGGDYNSQRYSPLTQITPANVNRLVPQWTFQTGTTGAFQTTPLLIDGVLYVTGFNNNAWAVDARSGRQIWRYRRDIPSDLHNCCGAVNRGFAVLGDRLFMTTIDAHLVALDMKTGSLLYDVELADYKVGYSATVAPLAVKDKIIIGIAGAEFGIRGFIDAYDPITGKRDWRFWTVAGPGDPGFSSWPQNTDAYKRGGGSIWVTGSYDPEQNLVFFGTGNPGPDYYSQNREGDNLYTASLVALDADTGKAKWHYQFTPHDVHDWDSTHVPILIDETIAGQPRQLVAVANRNGFFYVLDRTNGKFLLAKPYTQVTWAREVDADGRPIVLPNTDPTAEGNRVCPGGVGGTNWHSPSYSPRTHLFYAFSLDQCDTFMADDNLEPAHRPGRPFIGSAFFAMPEEKAEGVVRAIEPATGKVRWEFKQFAGAWAGVLSTAGSLVFSGDGQGNFMALNAVTGEDLWHMNLGAPIQTAAISYALDNRQFVTIAAGGAVFTFALPAAPSGVPARAGRGE